MVSQYQTISTLSVVWVAPRMNVPQEIPQQKKTLKVIYKNSGKKGLELITKLAEDKEK